MARMSFLHTTHTANVNLLSIITPPQKLILQSLGNVDVRRHVQGAAAGGGRTDQMNQGGGRTKQHRSRY